VAQRTDQDFIPESAIRASQETQDHHTGRGGAGNEHIVTGTKNSGNKFDENGTPVSLADRMKAKVLGIFKK
jgi:hypothetical protein